VLFFFLFVVAGEIEYVPYAAATLFVVLLLPLFDTGLVSASDKPSKTLNAELRRLRLGSGWRGMNSSGIVDIQSSVNQSGFSADQRSQFASVNAFTSSRIESQ
jgi:hypothetical protein